MAVNPNLGVGNAISGPLIGNTLIQALMNSQNQQGNNAVAPDPGMVRDASTRGQQFPFSVIPGATGLGMSNPNLKIGGDNPFAAPASQPEQSQQPTPTLSPLQQIIQNAVAKAGVQAPDRPNYAMSPEEQQQLQGLRDSAMNLQQQANQTRLQAAQQPLPQIHKLTALESLIPLIGSFADHTGKFNNAFNQQFEQQAQQQQQQGMQNYQQQQNAAGVAAQGLEQQAQTKLGQVASAIQQRDIQNELAQKTYAAEQGVYGKLGVAGVNAQSRQNVAQINADAKQVAAATAAQWHQLSWQERQALAGINNPKTAPADRALMISALQQLDPNTWGKLPPETIANAASQIPAGYVLDENKAAAAKAQGQKWYQESLDDEAWRDPKKQKLIADAQGIAARMGLDDAKTNLVAAQVAAYPETMKRQAALVYSQAALNRAKAVDIANGGGGDALANAKDESVILNREGDLVSKAISDIRKSNGGKAPDENSPDWLNFNTFTARQHQIQTRQAQLARFVQQAAAAATPAAAQPNPGVPRVPGAAAAYGTNPNAPLIPGQGGTVIAPAGNQPNTNPPNLKGPIGGAPSSAKAQALAREQAFLQQAIAAGANRAQAMARYQQRVAAINTGK